MPYRGSDLGQDFKDWFRKEKKRIIKELTKLACTDIQLDYGFYYLSGFFTSKTGQIYYISSGDWRGERHLYMYRTAKHYKDFTGGGNQWAHSEELHKMSLK